MNNRRKLGLTPGLNIGRAPHNDLGHRQSTDKARNHIPDPLGPKLTIGWGDILIGIQTIRRFDTKQGF